jgi:hypothetical protein
MLIKTICKDESIANEPITKVKYSLMSMIKFGGQDWSVAVKITP